MLKVERKPRGRPGKQNPLTEKAAQSNELQILKVYSEAEKLSETEQKTLSEILSSCPGVYHKPRPVMKTVIHAPERWHLIHASEYEFKSWCLYNRIENPMFEGYQVDILNMTSSGEGGY